MAVGTLVLKAVILFGYFLLLHAAYSMMQYRNYVRYFLKEDFYTTPVDISVEVAVGATLALVGGIISNGKFKNLSSIHTFNERSYAETGGRATNFRNYHHNRSGAISSVLSAKVPSAENNS
mmetsp:Transcript_14320/g.15791  ORF Transcript_14320/g.15791 Transcript_14320/m.15791 type:complete len:121 (-) Transcript_14320:204-566(-)